MDATGPKLVYSTGEAAAICKVSQQTVIRCFDNGTLGGFRVPGSKFRRITREALFKFMLDNRIPTDWLGELTPSERTSVAAKVMGPARFALPNRLAGMSLAPLTDGA